MALAIPKTQTIRGRACKNCTGPVPKSNNPGNTKKRAFCSDNCRKEFHKNNGISVHKLKDQVRQWVSEFVREEIDELICPTVADYEMPAHHSAFPAQKRSR